MQSPLINIYETSALMEFLVKGCLIKNGNWEFETREPTTAVFIRNHLVSCPYPLFPLPSPPALPYCPCGFPMVRHFHFCFSLNFIFYAYKTFFFCKWEVLNLRSPTYNSIHLINQFNPLPYAYKTPIKPLLITLFLILSPKFNMKSSP